MLFVHLGDQMWKGIDRMFFKLESGEIRWPDEESIYARVRMCRAEPSVKDRWLQEHERLYQEEADDKARSAKDDLRYESGSLTKHKLGQLGVCGYGKSSVVVDGLKGK